MIKPNDIIGEWTVIEKCSYKYANKMTMWKCKCSCGTIKDVREYYLKSGLSKSCGCKMGNKVSNTNTIHGDSGGKNGKAHYLYTTWSGIIQRTTNKEERAYFWYGARGIKMYEPWIKNYTMFRDWILLNIGERPVDTSLDRINNDGNYEPGNLKWSTRVEQANNRRMRKKLSKRQYHHNVVLCKIKNTKTKPIKEFPPAQILPDDFNRYNV